MEIESFVTSGAVADIFLLAAAQPVPSHAIAARLHSAFAHDPNVIHVEALLAYVYDRRPLDWSTIRVSAVDRPFADQLQALDGLPVHDDTRLTLPASAPSQACGRDLDLLATLHAIPVTLLMVVNALANLAIRPRQRVAVVSSARNEGISLLEWIAHYRVLGADGIFIYTNDNIDGSELLLDVLARHGVVHLIRNEIGADTPPQQKCYTHALHLLTELRDYRWAFFADADEFLVPAERYQRSMAALLDHAESTAGDALAAVCVHWRWFGSGKAFARTEGLLLERFRQSYRNEHVKSIVRLRDAISMHYLHVPIVPPGRIGVTSSLQPVPSMTVEMPTDYEGAELNHYWNKSFQEFVFKRMRGDGSLDASSTHKTFETFFRWGQKPRPDHPLDAGLVARVAAEVQRLLTLPGVSEARLQVERRFAEALADFDRRLDLRRLYDELAAAE